MSMTLSTNEASSMKIELICKNVYHIIIQDEKVRAAAMIRFQEHYESPFKEIKGKIFTLGQLKALGARSAKGANTYAGGNHLDSDWTGYNWPSYVLKPFIHGLFDPLTTWEQDIVEVFKRNMGNFYVICTDGGKALDHEIMHALYYTQPKYKAAVNKILKTIDLKELNKYLLSIGYCKEVLLDEAQAYIGADFEWITEKVPSLAKYEKQSKAMYAQYKKFKAIK